MDYIVLDMEWNQPWPGSPSAKKPLPVQIRGEIIQIGAVRILEDQTVADEFQMMIKPRFYRRLNKRVSKLTGIKASRSQKPWSNFGPGVGKMWHFSPGALTTLRFYGKTWLFFSSRWTGPVSGTMPR